MAEFSDPTYRLFAKAVKISRIGMIIKTTFSPDNGRISTGDNIMQAETLLRLLFRLTKRLD
jgi:hypothetical protein